MLIYRLLKCKTDPEGPEPLKELEDRNLRDSNAQIETHRMHAHTPLVVLMQIGYINESKL